VPARLVCLSGTGRGVPSGPPGRYRRAGHARPVPEHGSPFSCTFHTRMGYSEFLNERTTLLKAKIGALGCYTPPRVLTNQDLEKMVATNDQWIVDRTGIRERHIVPPEMATSDMAIEAAKSALVERGVAASELDAIIVCTVTPDYFFPSTACLVQHALGARGAWGFDLIAACSGFVYGLTTGAHLVAAGTHRKVLVIGADT